MKEEYWKKRKENADYQLKMLKQEKNRMKKNYQLLEAMIKKK